MVQYSRYEMAKAQQPKTCEQSASFWCIVCTYTATYLCNTNAGRMGKITRATLGITAEETHQFTVQKHKALLALASTLPLPPGCSWTLVFVAEASCFAYRASLARSCSQPSSDTHNSHQVYKGHLQNF